MHGLYPWTCIVDAIVLTKEAVMDALHTWSLLRLVIVVVMACPFLIIPALLGLRKKPRDTEKGTETKARPELTLRGLQPQGVAHTR